jgi:hypothetical protein
MEFGEQDEKWVKAAVVGGLWASVEVIVGSFLHNTRLPFAGTILAFTGTVLLLGFYSVWPVKGLIWRAGLITAIMKSISPSAIILGPMTGILLEALLVETVLRIGGKNLFSFIIASILSISSALLHKIVSLLIFYGFDLIQVYVNMVNFAPKQIKMPQAGAMEILYVLLAFYVVFGIVAGLTGYYTGKRVTVLKKSGKYNLEIKESPAMKDFFEIKNGNKTYLFLIAVHSAVIPAVLFLINYADITLAFSIMTLYMVLSGYRYRYSLRRLRKPVFWLQLVVIVLLSAFFWENGNGALTGFSTEGFYNGMEMAMRALFIVVAFTSLSVELRNRKVRNILYNAGLGKFYRAVSMAFGALPLMIGMLPTSKEIIRSPLKSFLRPLVMADKWVEVFTNE